MLGEGDLALLIWVASNIFWVCCYVYTLVHVFGLKPGYHRRIEVKPTIEQATSRLSQQCRRCWRVGGLIAKKVRAHVCSLATASEYFSDVGILILILLLILILIPILTLILILILIILILIPIL